MKKSRFTESQIVAILKEGEAGVAVAQLTRKHGISAATYHHWKSKYAGAGVAELKRLKPGVDQVARDADVFAALQAIVVEEHRWGFWKCHDRLGAQGYGWNHKRVWRVYCHLRLNLPRRTKRRVPQRERQPLTVEPRMNAVWALDFMRDTLYSGRVFRTLNVVDEANRGALGIDIAVSIPAARVITFLTQMIDLHGRPTAIRCDNGPELTSQSFTDWCKEQDIELRFIQPGKPDQNAYIERFDRTYREEVLSAYLFDSLDEVRAITVEWIDRYNEIRPHDALGSLPPARYREQLLAAETPV